MIQLRYPRCIEHSRPPIPILKRCKVSFLTCVLTDRVISIHLIPSASTPSSWHTAANNHVIKLWSFRHPVPERADEWSDPWADDGWRLDYNLFSLFPYPVGHLPPPYLTLPTTTSLFRLYAIPYLPFLRDGLASCRLPCSHVWRRCDRGKPVICHSPARNVHHALHLSFLERKNYLSQSTVSLDTVEKSVVVQFKPG